MNDKSDDFLAGAVAASLKKLKVSKLATGEMPPVLFEWFHIYNIENDECFVVLMRNDEDSGFSAIAAKENCCFGDKKSAAKALIKTMNLGCSQDEDNSEAFFCALVDGWVNSKIIDADVLRSELERGAAAFEHDFDFTKWANTHGFGRG